MQKNTAIAIPKPRTRWILHHRRRITTLPYTFRRVLSTHPDAYTVSGRIAYDPPKLSSPAGRT